MRRRMQESDFANSQTRRIMQRAQQCVSVQTSAGDKSDNARRRVARCIGEHIINTDRRSTQSFALSCWLSSSACIITSGRAATAKSLDTRPDSKENATPIITAANLRSNCECSCRNILTPWETTIQLSYPIDFPAFCTLYNIPKILSDNWSCRNERFIITSNYYCRFLPNDVRIRRSCKSIAHLIAPNSIRLASTYSYYRKLL